MSFTSAPSGGASLFSLCSSVPPSACSGRRSSRLQAQESVIIIETRGVGFSLPERAGARYINQPRVDTWWVEFVVAGKHADVFPNSKVLGTN